MYNGGKVGVLCSHCNLCVCVCVCVCVSEIELGAIVFVYEISVTSDNLSCIYVSDLNTYAVWETITSIIGDLYTLIL